MKKYTSYSQFDLLKNDHRLRDSIVNFAENELTE